MTIQLELPPHIETRLREEAANHGQAPEEYLQALLERELVLKRLRALKDRKPPQSLADIQPRVTTPPGKSWLDSIAGQWPANETDEQIDRALEELS